MQAFIDKKKAGVCRIVAVFRQNLNYAKDSIKWDAVTALENNLGRTILYTDDNQQFPIPSYDVISIFDNSMLVEKIIEFAGLAEDKTRKNFWSKPKIGIIENDVE